RRSACRGARGPRRSSGSAGTMNGKALALSAPVVDLERLKPLWLIYANMVLQPRAEWDPEYPLPRVVYRQKHVRANPERVLAYRDVCGEGPPDRMPPVYPHVLATPLQLNL